MMKNCNQYLCAAIGAVDCYCDAGVICRTNFAVTIVGVIVAVTFGTTLKIQQIGQQNGHYGVEHCDLLARSFWFA